MTIVKFEKINAPTTVAGNKAIVRVVVRELSLNKLIDVTIWLNNKEFIFSEGDEVEMDIRKGKPFHGKDQYSANVESIAPVVIPKEEPTKEDVPQKVWDAKDRRMCRCNALAHATEVIKMYLALNPPKDEKGEKVPLAASTIASLIQIEAESFEDWIYRNGSDAKDVGFE